jgi:hypothetical protein
MGRGLSSVRSKGKRKISRWWLLEERNDEEK